MSPERAPLVSVVTPAYNEELYIRECIESVLAQTYRDWHYVIVDNASTDRTFDIARGYAATDRRIQVVRNETTVPVIANFNIAFRQVSPDAKYCKVVGADDALYPECLEQMVRIAEANPTVALVGAYSLAGRRVDPCEFPFSCNIVSGREVCRNYLSRGPHLLGAPTPLMYRADVVRSQHAFFPEPALYADAEACLRLLKHHDYGFVHQVLTFTRVRENSLTSHTSDFGVTRPNILQFLISFGPQYFSAQELKQRIQDQLAYYYSYLGCQVFHRNDREFWTFHRDRLVELGYTLSKTRLMLTAILNEMETLVSRIVAKSTRLSQ